MKTAFIFDLDGTIVDSRSVESDRKARRWKSVREKIATIQPCRLVVAAINRLCRLGYEVAVVTSTPEYYCRLVLCFCGIDDASLNLVCYHDTKKHKPHPEPFLLAQSRMKPKCSVIYCIGDDEKDLRACIAADAADDQHSYRPIVAGWCVVTPSIQDKACRTQTEFVEEIAKILEKENP